VGEIVREANGSRRKRKSRALYPIARKFNIHAMRTAFSYWDLAKANHINGIENFWNQAKRHMRKFNGVPKQHFGLFLKECEWRFNNSDPSAQLTQLRQWVKGNLN
jgi:transposase-like protein